MIPQQTRRLVCMSFSSLFSANLARSFQMVSFKLWSERERGWENLGTFVAGHTLFWQRDWDAVYRRKIQLVNCSSARPTMMYTVPMHCIAWEIQTSSGTHSLHGLFPRSCSLENVQCRSQRKSVIMVHVLPQAGIITSTGRRGTSFQFHQSHPGVCLII